MLEYLKIKNDYAIDPRSRTFALMGISHAEKVALPIGNWKTELQVQGDAEISGILDLIEPDEDNPGHQIITDNKNFGSYRVATILGLEKHYEPHPTEVYQRSGKWGQAGTPKQVAVFSRNPDKADYRQEVLQLNHYRLLVEAQGCKVSKLQLQITVRDGGTMAAKDRGVLENIYYPVAIPILPNDEVRTYFEDKAIALYAAIDNNLMPEPCSTEENWDGRRCLGYCDVAELCPEGRKRLWVEAQKGMP